MYKKMNQNKNVKTSACLKTKKETYIEGSWSEKTNMGKKLNKMLQQKEPHQGIYSAHQAGTDRRNEVAP